MAYIDLLKTIWNSVYDPNSNTTSIIETFFHKDYEQCINGVMMTRSDYVEHVLAQKESITLDTIEYKQVLEKENELFAIYYIKARNKNNQPTDAEVIAYFRFEGQQILRIHGQVRLITGNVTDVDM